MTAVVIVLKDVPGRVTQGQISDTGLIAADFIGAKLVSAQVVSEVEPAGMFRALSTALSGATGKVLRRIRA